VRFKYRIVFLFIGIFCLISCTSTQKPFFENHQVLKSNERVAAYAIPNIISTNNGIVLCFATARIGDNQDWGNVMEVIVIRSTDNGETWDGSNVIASIPDWTVRQTSAIFIPRKNKIIVFGHKSPRFTPDGERISETWNIAHPEKRKELGAAQFIIESSDDGVTWSGMKDIDLPYWPHDPGISLKHGKYKGRLIVPARITKGTEFDWNNMYNAVLISDDDGDTWRAGGLTQSHVGEACVAELSDGRIYMNSRNHAENFGIRVHAISSDGGETFTEFGNDPELIEPTCDAGMTQFEHSEYGSVILFSNPAMQATKQWDSASRRRMTVKASFDDCKTWPTKRLVFEGPSAYSGLTVGEDGMIFLVYERAETGSKESRQNLAIARFNLEWLIQKEVIPPVIQPNSAVFFETQEVQIQSPDSDMIRYTLDGSDPQVSSNLYEKPFILKKSAILKAACFNIDGGKSIISEAVFKCSPYSAPRYKIKYSEKFPASGLFALVDGVRGTMNYNDGNWQGFESDDVDVTIDFTKIKSISEMKAGFLQSTDYWIFYPSEVEFSISPDGENFPILGSVKNENPAVNQDQSRRDFTTRFPETQARFVRLRAKNIKTCPSWHKGAGGKAWLFIDEIEIN
jgi:sialidase-1